MARMGVVAAAAVAALCFGLGARAAEPFTVSSSTFKDGQRLALEHAGKQAGSPNCVGQNVSPALAWTNTPEGTHSLAIVVYDPDGRAGLGAVHWVAYGVPTTVTSFAEGEAAKPGPSSKYVGGRSTGGLSYFMGPCPPPGTTDHHYIFSVMATDLAPDALPAGLSRDELFARLDGHVKAGSSLVAVFRHP